MIRTRTRSAARIARLSLAAAGFAVIAVIGLGCAILEHGYETSAYAGRPLAPGTIEGQHRLEAEARMDATIASYLAEHGRPDYFYVAGRQKVYFFYTRNDTATMFQRELIATSEVLELGRIPAALLRLVPPAEKERIIAVRKRAKAQKRRSAPTRRAAPAPAAVAPGGGYLSGFDAVEIVARMRPPMTAADPGVSGWREAQNREGKRVYSAKRGTTRYEVSTERVALTVALSSQSKRVPNAARLAVHRVNNAIFAAKAEAVTQRMLELLETVAGDRSGRTHFEKRIAGRTVRLGRLTKQGVIAYSVHP